MKKIIIFLIPFLLTGCATATYNLNISNDLSVVEEINMSATKEYFDGYYMNLPITIVKQAMENEELIKPLKDNNYYYELKKNNNPFPSVYASKKYNNINDYFNNTIFKDKAFEKVYMEEKDNFITIKSEKLREINSDDGNGQIDYYFNISDLKVEITLPFVVTSSNATKIDKKTNTYIWKINEENKDKKIELTFNKSMKYVYNFHIYVSIAITIILITIVIYICVRIFKNNKLNNEIM